MSTNILSLSPGINLIRGAVENLEAFAFDTNIIHNQIEKNSFGTHSGTCFLWALRRTSDCYSRFLTRLELRDTDNLFKKFAKLVCRLTAIPIRIAFKTAAVALWTLTMPVASLERFVIKAKNYKEIEQRQNAFVNALRKDRIRLQEDFYGRGKMLLEVAILRGEPHLDDLSFDEVFELDRILPGEELF